jgi:uncharacterized metal-binding protein
LTNLSITSGQTVNLTLTVTPANSFNQQVSFACSGGANVLSCAFAPSTLTPSGGAAAHTTLTVSAASQTASAKSSPLYAPLEGVAFACLLLVWKRRELVFQLVTMITLAAVLLSMNGCGSSPGVSTSTSPSPKTYTLTVTASAGTLQHTVQVQTTVE